MVVKGLAASCALLPVVGGCRMADPDLGLEPADANDVGNDAVQGTGFTINGNELALDLTHPLNSALLAAGGSRTIQVPGGRVLIVRPAAGDDFETISAVCTHQGQPIRYVAASTSFACSLTSPGHGSQFAINGEVTRGPAASALRQFVNAFDPGTNVLTVTLS